jgi:hypothetical protein
MRLPRHQYVTCAKCGATRFILPVSPLPDVAAESSASIAARGRYLVVLLCLGAVGLLALGLVLARPWEQPTTRETLSPPTEELLQQRIRDAQDALSNGAYRRATRNFEEALDIQRRLGNLSEVEQRRLTRLRRQSSLLADLLAESPAAILRHSIGLPEADWNDVFRERYAGRSFLLDDTISRNAAGQYQYEFRIVVLGMDARIDLAQLRLLRDLPLLQPQRLLLGMRLAGTRREPSGGWTILPDPESGVLITDPEMLAGLSIPDDADTREVLKRQRGWVEAPPY